MLLPLDQAAAVATDPRSVGLSLLILFFLFLLEVLQSVDLLPFRSPGLLLLGSFGLSLFLALCLLFFSASCAFVLFLWCFFFFRCLRDRLKDLGVNNVRVNGCGVEGF